MLKLLEHKWTANIVGIITALATIVGVIIAYLQYYSQTTSATELNTHMATYWTEVYTIVAIIIVISLAYGAFHLVYHKNKQQNIIGTLSTLLGSYILNPKYVTAIEHANHSKEGALAKGGTANILTNSLNYDMSYSKAIAENIIKGAKYVYILPNTRLIITELQNYISIISHRIHDELMAQRVNNPSPRVEELRRGNIEFWFFDREHPCLYNFAIFRQPAEDGCQPFDQCWWYINPSDTNANSHMLTYEITETRDRSDLDEIFAELKERASKKTGHDVYTNRENLDKWIGANQ